MCYVPSEMIHAPKLSTLLCGVAAGLLVGCENSAPPASLPIEEPSVLTEQADVSPSVEEMPEQTGSQPSSSLRSRLLGPNPKERLVGHWSKEGDSDAEMTLGSDGAARWVTPDMDYSAEYEVLNDTTIQINMNGMTMPYYFSYEGSTLVMRDIVDEEERWILTK